MIDARDYTQLLHRINEEEYVTLFLKDKRNSFLWIEINKTQSECSTKSLLHPKATPPCMRMPITQEELDSGLQHPNNKAASLLGFLDGDCVQL